MYIFDYHDKELNAERTPLEKIAQEIGTPFYCYSRARLRQNYQSFVEPFSDLPISVRYALNANPNRAIVAELAACGAGAEISSQGEFERASSVGIPAERMGCNGLGKTRQALEALIAANIGQIGIESIDELQMASQAAQAVGRPASIALRINPDLNARSNHKTTSASGELRFGLDISQLAEALVLASTLPGLNLVALSTHVQGHGFDYAPFRRAFQIVADLVQVCRSQGVKLSSVNLGGGVGVPSSTQKLAPFVDYVALVREFFGALNLAIALTPGRRLVGDAGILVARVLGFKKTPSTNFLVIDAAMNDFPPGGLNTGRHDVLPVTENQDMMFIPLHLVGSITEPEDIFGENYFLPQLEPGALVALLQAGAYASAGASTYQSRPLIPEVMVDGDRFFTIRRRIPVAEQLTWENLPSWTKAAG